MCSLCRKKWLVKRTKMCRLYRCAVLECDGKFSLFIVLGLKKPCCVCWEKMTSTPSVGNCVNKARGQMLGNTSMCRPYPSFRWGDPGFLWKPGVIWRSTCGTAAETVSGSCVFHMSVFPVGHIPPSNRDIAIFCRN